MEQHLEAKSERLSTSSSSSVSVASGNCALNLSVSLKDHFGGKVLLNVFYCILMQKRAISDLLQQKMKMEILAPLKKCLSGELFLVTDLRIDSEIHMSFKIMKGNIQTAAKFEFHPFSFHSLSYIILDNFPSRFS